MVQTPCVEAFSRAREIAKRIAACDDYAAALRIYEAVGSMHSIRDVHQVLVHALFDRPDHPMAQHAKTGGAASRITVATSIGKQPV